MAWLSGWAKRVKLTIDQTDIDAALVDFPILLYLGIASGRLADDISFIFDELTQDANRFKIAVTQSDGTTECYVEIEKWDDANEKAWLWVKAPAIAADVDTDLYLYYDSAHADNTNYVGDPNSVPAETAWDANFVFVSHMADDPGTSNIRDSSTNDNDGTKLGAAEPAVTTSGKVANAQDFDGSNDYIALAENGTLDITTNITLEAWINPALVTSYRTIISKRTGNFAPYVVRINEGKLEFYYSGPQATTSVTDWHVWTSTSAVIAIDTWYHVAVKFAFGSGTVSCHVNGGSAIAGSWAPGDGTEAATSNNQPVWLGGFTGQWFNNIIDEARISDALRADAWIKATYETGRDDLLDWGSEETSGWANIAKVSGVTSAGIAKMNNVAVAAIAKVNSVAV